jgi:hypothetical protein
MRSIEKSNDLIGNRTRALPACSIVPQRTTLPRAPLSQHLPEGTEDIKTAVPRRRFEPSTSRNAGLERYRNASSFGNLVLHRIRELTRVYPADGGNAFFRIFGKHLLSYTASHTELDAECFSTTRTEFLNVHGFKDV